MHYAVYMHSVVAGVHLSQYNNYYEIHVDESTSGLFITSGMCNNIL